MRNFLLIALAIVSLCSCSKDEVEVYGGIYGTIRDALTGTPIYNAEISLSPGQRTTVSGTNGTYDFQNLESMQYSLSVTASGYVYNTRQVNVIPGENTMCDMRLTPESDIEGIRISTTVLDFGTTHTNQSFTVYNTGNVPINWQITGVDENWLTVTPMNGTIEVGQSSAIIVKVDRSLVNETKTAMFSLNAAGG